MTVIVSDIFLLKTLLTGLLYHDMAPYYRRIALKYRILISYSMVGIFIKVRYFTSLTQDIIQTVKSNYY